MWEGEHRLYLPVSLVAEIGYCPRNFYLRAVQGAEDRNWWMVKGGLEEALRNRQPSRHLPEGGQQVYSVLLASEALNLIGVVDLVIVDQKPVPVEFKTGSYVASHPAHDLQVCLQGLLLEENLQKPVPVGYVYYTASRKRRQVPLDDALRQQALEALEQARRIVEGEWVPEPQPRESCTQCALFATCLPFAQEAAAEPAPAAPPLPRSLQVVQRVLYIDTPGASLGKRGDSIRIRRPGEMFDLQVPLTQVDQVVLVGNVQISSQLLRVLLARGVPVVYLTGRGRFSGITLPETNRNLPLRLAQFRAYDRPEQRLALARGIVAGKLHNQRLLLRRHLASAPDAEDALRTALHELRHLRAQVADAPDLETLRGLEGIASRKYFAALGRLFPEPFERRNRRPPRDPVNATLSFLYTLLLKDLVHLVFVVGLDPYLGFLHSPHFGRPALALDLMEEFRPIVADALALSLWKRGQLKPEHFTREFGGVYFKESARKAVVRAYEAKKREQLRHPRFGYRLPYFRHMEMQVRILGKVLLGEWDSYVPFTPK